MSLDEETLDQQDVLQVIEDENEPMENNDSMSEDNEEENEKEILFQDHSIQGFFGHEQNPVYCITSHPKDPSIFLSGGGDDKAHLWNCETGQVLYVLPTHKDSVSAVAFNHDGSFCASAGMDGIVHVMNTNNSSETLTLDGPSCVTCLNWHPKGNVLLAGSEDGTIWMWNIPSGTCMFVFSGHSQEVNACQFSPDGKRMISISSDASLIIWDPKTSGILFKLSAEDSRFHQAPIHSLDVYKEMILTGAEDGSIRLTHLTTGKILSSFENHAEGVEAVAFSPSLNFALTGSLDGLVCIWDLNQFELRQSVQCHQDAITKLIWEPKGSHFISVSMDGLVCQWDARTGTNLKTWKGHLDGVLDVALNANASKLCTASDDGTCLVFALD